MILLLKQHLDRIELELLEMATIVGCRLSVNNDEVVILCVYRPSLASKADRRG